MGHFTVDSGATLPQKCFKMIRIEDGACHDILGEATLSNGLCIPGVIEAGPILVCELVEQK